MFDFSGTLMRAEPVESWLAHVLEDTGISLDRAEFDHYAAQLAAAGAQPGGRSPREVPGELREVWASRDVSAAEHRAAYLGLARHVPLPIPELYEALYARHREPAAWQPYPDAARLLAALGERGVPVAVVSDIGWDPRPVFRAYGLDSWVSVNTLSFEHGAQRPDPRLFRAACDALGTEPRDVLMVGDDARADGGAAGIGCAVRLVDHLPVEERPADLLPVLADTAAGPAEPT